MVCNELNRGHNNRQDPMEYRNCLERSLELMDFALKGNYRLSKRKEFCRARDVVATAYLQEPESTLGLQEMLLKLSPAAWTKINCQ